MQSTIKVFAVGYLSNKLKHVHARLSEKDLANEIPGHRSIACLVDSYALPACISSHQSDIVIAKHTGGSLYWLNLHCKPRDKKRSNL